MPDNGPNVTPAPPGPTPHGLHEYLVVAHPTIVLPNAPFFLANTTFQQIEGELLMRNAPADRLDLLDGRRVYRVHVHFLWKLDHDRNGCFIGRAPLPVFRFILDDPTTNEAAVGDWEPVY